jgi:hypothetical protein
MILHASAIPCCSDAGPASAISPGWKNATRPVRRAHHAVPQISGAPPRADG